MRNVNKKKLFNFLILVSLFHRIRGEFSGIKEQRKIASGPQLKNNFGEIPGETVITTAITVDDEKFDDYELRKLFVQKFKWYENLERERNSNVTPETFLRRKIRNTANGTTGVHLECLSCFSNSTSSPKSDCFIPTDPTVVSCPEDSVCATELHPDFAKRGCVNPNKLVKTFICKCQLCNDKSVVDPTFFNYNSISDWAYHNQYLQIAVIGVDLICKVCSTRGTSTVSDDMCKSGKTTDYKTCGRNQFCFTLIDQQTDFVSRGCITMPVYNSIHIFCEESKCNNIAYQKLILKQYAAAEEKIMTKMSFRAADDEVVVRKNSDLPIKSQGTLVLTTKALISCSFVVMLL